MDVVHLEIGEPDFDTPQNVVETGIDALRQGWTHYTPASGLPELREAIAEEVSRTRGVKCTADEVVVVPGGKPTIFFAFMSLVEEEDEVIYPNPGFPIYESMISFLGAKPVPLPLREEKDFRLDPNELADLITDRTRLIVLNSPHNPTGSVLEEQDVRDIAAAIGGRDIMVLSDEIYSRLIFEGKHFSLMSVPGMKDRTILLDGFSKTYAMTGWRLGYGVMRPDLARQFSRLIMNVNSCTASFTQIAGIEALRGDQSSVDEKCREFKRRRDCFVQHINRINGFSCRVPRGAF
jgi:aspartate/methionine/tyrosine aminotransferase